MNKQDRRVPKGSSTNVVGFALNPYLLHCSFKDLTSSSSSACILLARSYKQKEKVIRQQLYSMTRREDIRQTKIQT
jgi:hypothetical protein